MRKKIVAGNWKMNKNFQEANDLINDITDILDNTNLNDVNLIVCPPFPYLELATDISIEKGFSVGAQNVSEHEKGAYTGEISAEMLSSMEVEYCIIGHSERRMYFNETNHQLAKKTVILLKNDITPIYCCGESLTEREAEKHFDIVKQQIEEGLFELSPTDFSKIIIAYEPVWAIGTGKTATAEQAQEMHAFIRSLINKKYGNEIADNISILYGGSCNPKNAKELFSNPDVDGGLIGGASLVAEDFIKIAQSF